MKLFERLALRPKGQSFHTGVVTTFAVEFGAFEQILLPQLQAAGAANVVLLADPRMTALALSNGMELPREAGSAYVVSGRQTGPGVFHPKIILQVGRRAGRVIVSSANATSAGISGNREIAAEVNCTAEPSPSQEFVKCVWRYLRREAGTGPSPAREGMAWGELRAPWLTVSGRVDQSDNWEMEDETALGFLGGPSDTGRSIFARFIDLIGPGPVDHLVIASPYWDHGLGALRALQNALAPKETILMLQKERELFPTSAAQSLSIRIVDPPPKFGAHFMHAKLIIVRSGNVDHVLAGSANCTLAALGGATEAGVNSEASLYRRLPAGTALETLGLTSILTSPEVPLSAMPAMRVAPEIPLHEGEVGNPGSFEAAFGKLTWCPPEGCDPQSSSIQLLDGQSRVLATLAPEQWAPSGDRFATDIETIAAETRFARLTTKGWTSLPAIIHRLDKLGDRRRERPGRAAERAQDAVDGAFDLEFLHLEMLADLEKADEEDMVPRPAAARAAGGRAQAADAQPIVLTYGDFLETRNEAATPSPFSRNALSGQHADSARSMLNRIMGISAASSDHEEKPKGDPFDYSDETGESEENPDDREGETAPSATTDEMVEKVVPPPPRPCDSASFVRSVSGYPKLLAKRIAEDRLGATDVLRLRLLLTLVLANALPPSAAKDVSGLKCGLEETGWPRMILRVLGAFFVGRSAPIQKLTLDPAFDRMPDDFMEAWATAICAIEATRRNVVGLHGAETFLGYLKQLEVAVRERAGLTPAEISGGVYVGLKEKLDRYFGSRLGPVDLT